MKIEPLTNKVIQELKIREDLVNFNDKSFPNGVIFSEITQVNSSIWGESRDGRTTFIREYSDAIIRKSNGDIYFGKNAKIPLQWLYDKGLLKQDGGED